MVKFFFVFLDSIGLPNVKAKLALVSNQLRWKCNCITQVLIVPPICQMSITHCLFEIRAQRGKTNLCAEGLRELDFH